MAAYELYSSNSNQYIWAPALVPDKGLTIALTLVGAGDTCGELQTLPSQAGMHIKKEINRVCMKCCAACINSCCLNVSLV